MNTKDIENLHSDFAGASPGEVKDRGAQPVDPNEERLDKIAEAHKRVADVVEGFDKLAEKAEPSFRPVAEAFLAMHRAHHRELAEYLERAGRTGSEQGTFFGAVNRAVIEARSWFEDVDASVMDRVKEGEKHVLDAYSDARETGQTVEANAMLTRHMTEIDGLLVKHAD